METTLSKEQSWPPSEEYIRNLAVNALNKSEKKDVKVLLYWDNPQYFIYDPIHFANTEFIINKFKLNERSVQIYIGRED